MIITTIRVVYRGDKPAETLQIDQYAFSRLAVWARQNGMAGLSPDSAEGSAEQLLCMQVMCWAQSTRGVHYPVAFDEWLASVDTLDAAEPVAVDPTQPATSDD